jgi:hypothetical protein
MYGARVMRAVVSGAGTVFKKLISTGTDKLVGGSVAGVVDEVMFDVGLVSVCNVHKGEKNLKNSKP